MKTNDFVINIATINGSGSQSANSILLKTLFRMGIPVGGKNVFPSNIQGLPTWFWIRASEKFYTSRRDQADIVIAMNPQTLREDLEILKPGGVFLYNADLKMEALLTRTDVQKVPMPIKALVDQSTTQGKIKKLVANIVYVGIVAELLGLEEKALTSALHDQFNGKASVIEVNDKAMQVGREYAKSNLKEMSFPYKAEARNLTKGKIMVEGNAAGGLGLVCGGAGFAAWYPITPSSSLVENFSKYAQQMRIDDKGQNKFAILQAEDEISSICMVLGAAWSGTRAFTATSGPGISLMQEAIGYAYYTEIPAVIWDVQRVGPSTGMPTRNAQGDILSAHFSSHGDTKHPVLFPGSPGECFEFGQTCFDLAERLQTPVFVLSDLDIGMNLWLEDEFTPSKKPFDRGKLRTDQELADGIAHFRYKDSDGDGIPYRTLPGAKHPAAAYVVRGSGHTTKAQYTERADEYVEVVDRLTRKWETARRFVPPPIIEDSGEAIGILLYGSTSGPLAEARDLLKARGVTSDFLRVRALPFTSQINAFIAKHRKTYVVDLNRDGQMHALLLMEWPELHAKLSSLRHYEGTPITADWIANQIESGEMQKEGERR